MTARHHALSVSRKFRRGPERRVPGRLLRVETLEPRHLLSGEHLQLGIDAYSTLANGLPILNSRAQAAAAIFLDLDGDPVLGMTAYSEDADLTTFNATEQQHIANFWRQVAVYYAMFDVNVTTIQPDVATVSTAWACISNSEDHGHSGTGRFPNRDRSHSWVPAWDVRNRPTGVVHEVGHNFGLWHQSDYDQLGNKTQEYAVPSDDLHGAIMGYDYMGTVHKWKLGHTEEVPYAPTTTPGYLQEDLTIISSAIASNAPAGYMGDGFATDDYAGDLAHATSLIVNADTQSIGGVIERLNDADAFSFTVSGGHYSVQAVRDVPSQVDLKLSIYDSLGHLVAVSDGDPRAEPLAMVNNQQLTMDLGAGTYYAVAESHGNYDDLGPYVLSVAPLPAGWYSRDVGVVMVPGYTTYSAETNTYTVAGAGIADNAGGTRDAFQFAYQVLEGDGSITIRASSLPSEYGYEHGLMVRTSLDADAPFVSVAYIGGFPWQATTRTSAGAPSQSEVTSLDYSWCRLERHGQQVFVSLSPDGAQWTPFGLPVDLPLGASAYFGLTSTTANGRALLNVVTFTDVSLVGHAPSSPVLNALPAPGGVTVEGAAATQIALSWTPVAGATGYAIERSDDGTQYWRIATTGAGATSFQDSGLSDFQRYFYRVRAVDTAGASPPSAVISGVTRAGAVSNLSVTSWTTTQLVLNWTDASGETGYRIERSPDGATGWTVLGTVGRNVPSFTDSAMQPGTQYFYRVVTLDQSGDSAAAETTGATRIPVVDGLTLAAESTRMTLAWRLLAEADGYRIERSTNGTIYDLITTVSGDASSYVDSDVRPLGTYYYRVYGLKYGNGCLSQSVAPASAFAAAPAEDPLPLGWNWRGLGVVGGSGGAAGYDGGTFTLVHSGDLSDPFQENCQFVYREWTGDVALVARVASQNEAGFGGAAALMIRDGVQAKGYFAAIGLARNGNCGLSSRYHDQMSTLESGPVLGMPYWLQLVRQEGTITASVSPDGVTWTVVATKAMYLSPHVYVGFAANSDSTDLFNTVRFDHVQIGAPTPTVAVAVSATPHPGSSTKWDLSVLGADVGGEQNLTYTWGRADAYQSSWTFSANGTNAAKNTVVTLAGSGVQTIAVTIANGNGYSTTSTVTITVDNVLTAIRVQQSPETVLYGGSGSGFDAQCLNQFGQAFDGPSVTWTGRNGVFSASSPGSARVSFYAPETGGDYVITAEARSGDVVGSIQLPVQSGILGRYLIYNNSHYDGEDAAANSLDDGAIAIDKRPLLPGETARFENYSSFSRGITGIAMDVANLRLPLTASDFVFKVGNSSDPSSWTVAPAPSDIIVRRNAGVDGSNRIVVAWPDDAIKNQWLQVTANLQSGADVFYFGNVVAETGDSSANAVADSQDVAAVVANPSAVGVTEPITSRYDLNRDGRVDAADVVIAQAQAGGSASPLQLITVPAVPTYPPPNPPGTQPPTDIHLSATTIAENELANTPVGAFSIEDADPEEICVYQLVAGAGDDDNDRFAIVGNQLLTAGPLDSETRAALSIRVQAIDSAGLTVEKAFAVHVTDANDAPAAISLSSNKVSEDSTIGTLVGVLAAADQDAGDTCTYRFIDGPGGDDNARFTIVGDQLITAVALDYDTKSTMTVRVEALDSGGLGHQKVLTIQVTNVNEPPAVLYVSWDRVPENSPIGTLVAFLVGIDLDIGDTLSYALVEGPGDTGNADFTVVGSQLRTTAVFDYENKTSYSVRVRVTDAGGLSLEKPFTVNVTDVYDFTTCGVYDPATAQFYLSTQNNWGGVNAPFGFGAPNWKAVAGDWNGDGQDTIGLFDPSCNQFYLRNANDTGPVDVCFGYGVPNSGQVVVMGDWDGDGDETVGLYTPSASFFELRNSAGGGMAELSLGFGAPGTDSFFDPKVYSTGGGNPQAVTAGDFNRDGNTDVALTNTGSNTVSVLYGDGRGGLSAAATYTTGGTSPQSLVAADFNADGYLDLAVTNRVSGRIGVLLGSASGFAAAKTYSAGGTAPYGIASGDFNADGKADLVVTNRGSGNVAVLLGNGTGGFGTASTFSTGGTSPQALVQADFNADGKLDVAAANVGSNNISILLGNGAGRFGTATKFASGGTAPNGLAAADFDRDGKLDLAVSNGASTVGIGILRGNGSGGFAAAEMHSSGAANPSGLVAGDFNDDGVQDVAVIHGGNVSVMYAGLSGSSPSFPTIKTFSSGGTASWLATADFSGDGKLDLAVANSDATGTVSILLNYRWEPVVGDWDGDGCDTIGLYDPMTAMFYLRNSLTTGMADIAFPYGSAQSGWQPLIGDWNGDGRDSAGFFIYNANHFFLRDAFTAGMADYSFAMGEANKGWRPLVGNWRGAVAQPLLAADGPVSSSTTATALTSTAAQPVIDAALARWAELGIAFNTVQVVVTDLPGAMLGQAVGQTIYLDSDAAGHGWFIDPTPLVDEEFAQLGGRNALAAISPAVDEENQPASDRHELTAIDPRAADRIDLLTAVEHELGHVAGLKDLDATGRRLMSSKLSTGIRRHAKALEIDAVFAGG